MSHADDPYGDPSAGDSGTPRSLNRALDRREGSLTHRARTGPGRLEKLVRDRVPDLIRADGGSPDVRVAEDGEYLMLLRAKLYEKDTDGNVIGLIQPA